MLIHTGNNNEYTQTHTRLGFNQGLKELPENQSHMNKRLMFAVHGMATRWQHGPIEGHVHQPVNRGEICIDLFLQCLIVMLVGF